MKDIIIKIYSEKIRKKIQTKSVVIYYVLYGACDLYFGKKNYNLKDEEFILINSNEPHTLQTAIRSLAISVEFDFQEIVDLTRNPVIRFSDLKIEQHSEQGEQLRLIMKKIISVHTYQNYADKIRKLQYFYDLLLLLLDNFVVQTEEGRGGENDRKLAILEYVHTNFKKEISLQDLADKLFLSVPYLSKYIKQTVGIGFVEYVNEVRLSYAVDELIKTDHSLTKIAFNNGFSNLNSLNRVFKQTYGKMPAEYRKEYRQQEQLNEQEERELLDKVKEYFAQNPIQEQKQVKNKLTLKMNAKNYKSYMKTWNYFYSISNAEELLNSMVRDHVLIMKKELSIKRVGIWSMFVKELFIDMNAEYYNFNRIDYILDFLVENDLKPVLELTEHPKELYDGRENALLYERGEFSLKSLLHYERFLKSFIEHCISRYGMDEVSEWEFELGWDERIPIAGDEISFLNLFQTAWMAIKQLLPQARVGGGALFVYDNGELVEEVLEKWSKSVYKPDFISIWLFPYDLLEEGEFRKFRMSKEKYYFSDKLTQVRKIMRKYGLKDIPLYLSRWNMSLTCRNMLNNSCYKGAYAIRSMIECMDNVDAMAYYGSTDLLYEYLDSVKTITGGYGLISKDGIRKPSYYAFLFMNQLGEYLIKKGENYIVTTNKFDSYYIVCQNCGRLSMDYFFRKEYEPYYVYQRDEKELILNFCLEGVKAGRYQVKTYFINQDVGGILEEWMRLGYPDILDREDIEYLKSVCIPRQVSINISTEDDILSHQTVLSLNEIQFIRIKYLID